MAARITKQDRRRADSANHKELSKALSRLSDDKLADFIYGNIDDLKKVLKVPLDLYDVVDDLRNGTHLHRKSFLNAFKKVPDNKIGNLETKSIKYKSVDPELYAEKREHRDESRRQHHKRGRQQLANGVFGETGRFLMGTASFVGMAAWLASRPFVITANGIQAVEDLFHMSKKARVGLLASAWMGVGVVGAMASDSAPYIHLMDQNVRSAFSDACSQDILGQNNLALATYAVAFHPDENDTRGQHAYYTMMVGASHNMPPIALHLTSYFETNRFSDFIANNSSASNPFQFLNLTKLAYLKKYGQETFAYQEAQERIESGSGSFNDKLLVLAIDTVHEQSDEELRIMLDKKKMEGAAHDGLSLADTSAMASELTALDMLDKYPELRDPNITPDKVLEIVVNYYQKYHFLGEGNYRDFVKLAAEQPGVPVIIAAASLGPTRAKHLTQVIDGNPSLVNRSMDSGEALAAIKKNFTDMVMPEFQKYKEAYEKGRTVANVCLADTGSTVTIPERISNFEIAKLFYGTLYNRLTPAPVQSLVQEGFNAAVQVTSIPVEPTTIEAIINPAINPPIPLMRPAKFTHEQS